MAMPLIMIASCGLRPMTSGKTNVAPNIADDVLGTEPDRPAPREPLVGGDDVVGAHGLAVPVQFPAQSHSDSYGCPREARIRSQCGMAENYSRDGGSAFVKG